MLHPRYNKKHHHAIVMAGIIACSYLALRHPELGDVAHSLSFLTNLIWLWEPEA